ncbi:MAG TPA: maleylpyruvate isomerase [Humidesulfovibrio sp.]|uniref:DinB family protein n=1 Tax=Humidesulfovibrio sp. TaxID=2910988 RepID=UPI002D017734|nr:maleylpyruvate isomerase [Humidesulfovibrio sp.]HWR04138.1 maleylpyruvate isomerase [Humidesulfovibrio sp.]
MATTTGTHLAEIIRAALAELKAVCAGVDEATASRAPAGRWSPKEILSHLIGAEEGDHLALCRKFTEADVPLIDIVPEQTHLTPERSAMSFSQLAQLVEREYEGVAAYALTLSEEQFARTAHIPLFKQSPLTEYPTLAAIVGGMGQYHVRMHTDHLRQVLAELAAK